jgi:uncharacterized protein YaiE (UPF0345 family)
MIKVNEYFSGKVKSLALQTAAGPATIGVILPGEYEFGTATQEIMHVTAGVLEAQLPGAANWVTYRAGEKFEIAKDQKFKVKATGEVAYLCEYR